MKKQVLMLLLATSLTVTALTACGEANDDSLEITEDVEVEETEEDGEMVIIEDTSDALAESIKAVCGDLALEDEVCAHLSERIKYITENNDLTAVAITLAGDVINDDPNLTYFRIELSEGSEFLIEYSPLTNYSRLLAYRASGYTLESEIVDSIYDDYCDIKNVTRRSTHNYMNPAAIMDILYSGENTLFSETGMDMALGMVGNGTSGELLSDIEAYYGYSLVNKTTRDNELIRAYENYSNCAINIQTGLYSDTTLPLINEYIVSMTEIYHSDITNIDFASNSSTSEINSYFTDNTDSAISDLVSADILFSNKSIILNTFTFEGEWVNSLSKDNQASIPFANLDGTLLAVDGLNTIETTYYANDYATAFGKYYTGYDISFIGILPSENICDESGNFNVCDLDISSLLSSKTTDVKIDVTFPTFECSYAASLQSGMSSVVTSSLFELGNADNFSNMCTNNMSITEIIQMNIVKVSNNCSDTGAAVKLGDEEEFYASVTLDRPFAFIIYDETNDEILCIGKIVQLDGEEITEEE